MCSAPNDAVDHAVGIVCRRKRGDSVEEGEPLAEIHAHDEASAEVAVSEPRASRALFRMEAAVSAPTAVNVRSTSAASDLTWLAASEEAATRVVWASRAPAMIALADAECAVESARSISAERDLT